MPATAKPDFDAIMTDLDEQGYCMIPSVIITARGR